MLEILRKIPLFSGLTEDELQAVAGLISRHDIPKKNIVVQEGEPGEALYIILEGSVKISSYSADGREIVLSLLNKGSFFGEMALLDKQPRSANVTTMEDSRFAQVRRADLEPLLLKQPGIALKLLAEVVSRLRRTSRVLERISSMDVPHRLYAYLTDHCHRFGQREDDEWFTTVLPTHQLLADQLSTSRETVSRAISALKKEGILVQDGGRGQMKVDVGALETLLEAFQ